MPKGKKKTPKKGRKTTRKKGRTRTPASSVGTPLDRIRTLI